MPTFMYTCGVPWDECQGVIVNVSARMRNRNNAKKLHSSRADAFACMRRYLIEVKGAEQIGSREFRMPDGSGVRVLTKKSRYGGEWRTGKYGTRWMPGGPHTGSTIDSH
jgi:hypothetical protein